MAPLPSAQQSVSPPETQSCPAIAFQVAGHWLALPRTALLRIVYRTALNQDVESPALVYLGKQPLTILNLGPHLVGVRGVQRDQSAVTGAPLDAQFFVIAAVETTIVGIAVDQLPFLLDLSLETTHAVPSSYYSTIQGIASHVVSVPQLGAVLLLNLYAVGSGLFSMRLGYAPDKLV